MATNQMRREAAKRKLERQQERRVQQERRRKRVAAITSVAVVVVVVVGIVLFTTLSGGEDATPAADPAPTAVTPAEIPTEAVALPVRPEPLPNPTTCAFPADGSEAAKPVQPPAGTDVPSSGTVAVTLQTSAGAVPLTLDRALAPCTVDSFVSLTQQGYFDQTPCHRLTTDPGLQVLQCGDPTGTGQGGPGYTVPDEFFDGLTYGRGILAMANTGQPNSGGSQFFMVYGDGELPPQYTAFGSIDPAGLEVVDTIARAGHDGSLDPSPGGGAPVEPVVIETATIAG
ncbi:peptidylprolyl isomerase [Pseudonocardia petroleophila]|uniref:Peptidylprolyl isomerase n=1 Tax=Pseudonocardia petroleophila TaxID=37331 RepID=A0A7G7MDS0_9PSEU|nr:peptidylprolyl isomerase [Pseudonocardia petroleophila]QNG50931.1 peptidylprolyl isomerase [Pseudonocardia petroleophila]